MYKLVLLMSLVSSVALGDVVVVVAPGASPASAPPQSMLPPAPEASHSGITFEANLGVGVVRGATSTGMDLGTSDAALAGADLGLGFWLSPHLALTGRIAGVSLGGSNVNGTVIAAFIGPSLQYWVGDHLWFGLGGGLATLQAVSGCDASMGSCGTNGFGLDFRAGYSFGTTGHTFNVSLESTPGVYSGGGDNNTTATITGVALLLGYQHL